MKSRVKAYRWNNRRKSKKSPQKAIFLVLAIVSFLAAITWAAGQAAALRIFVIGDSTASSYNASSYPQAGWGQELGLFFNKSSVTVINKAIGGLSARTYLQDGSWTSTLAAMQKGDYCLISFGTNDRGPVAARHADTAQFRQYMTQFVNESRAKGVIPVLVSTVNQNSWNGSTFTEGFAIGDSDYRGAVLNACNALKVPFVDLERKSAALNKSMGQEYCAGYIYISLAAGEYPNYPNGRTDKTHFQEMGAIAMAQCVAEGIKELSTDPDVGKLAAELAPQYPLNVSTNKPGAGLITASGAYPAGAPITIKVVPNTGETFQQWRDAGGKSITTEKRYQFTMGAAPSSYSASYKGGTAVSRAQAPSAVRSIPSVVVSDNGMISIMSNETILAARVTDLSGKSLLYCEPNRNQTTLDIGWARHGIYLFSARTAGTGLTTYIVRR
jgi:lysophospholipase L1-like esterase